jgi:lipopolysaccharide heptosyltransferase II
MPAIINPPDQNPLSMNIKRILVIRLDNLGDVVMTGPAFRALREAFPNAHLTLMASPGGSQAAPLLPWIDDVIVWRATWQDISKSAPIDSEKELQLFSWLRDHRFDAAFIFTSFSQSPYPPAYACYMAGIPVRIGQSKEFGGALLTHWIASLPDEIHQVERNLHLVRMMGLKTERNDLELTIRPEFQQSADEILNKVGVDFDHGFIALAPGASADARRYGDERFAKTASILAEQKLHIVLLGSQREIGTFPALEEGARQNRKIVSLIGSTSVVEMAAIIRRSRVLLANNSGAMHIAAAFQRPMVILFSGTELIGQWAPTTSSVEILNRATHCTPCHGFSCPYALECLDFEPEEVAQAVLRLYNQANQSAVRYQNQPTSPRLEVSDSYDHKSIYTQHR